MPLLNSDVIIKLRTIFREIFDDDTMHIAPSTMREDIEDWDSVAHIKLVLAIEEEFAVRMSTEEVSSVKSVAGFMKAIERHFCDR
ncbi:MAG: acyl carrier protein [Chlorobiaceae bacterium]|nr:acyl carrier protein [Chlorobiaceae bacterium]